jgi:hypothetical protein
LKEVSMKPLCLAMIAVGFLAILPATAQPVISAKSGLLSYVEGTVLLNDQPVEFSTTRFADVKENSIVKTEDGRAEVLLTPGVTLRMGENSSLRMIANRLVDTRVELLSGSAVIEADLIAKDTNVTMIVGQGSVALPKAGLYRLDASPAQLKVFKGDAEVEIAGQTKTVSTAHMLSLATETASIERFDPEDTDALDRWSHRRGSYMAMANTSAARSLVSSNSIPSGWGAGSGWGTGSGWGFGNGLGLNSGLCSSAWGYNAYYGMMTFIPCTGSLWSPYGYRFWSPYAIRNYSWVNPPAIYGGGASRTAITSTASTSLARPATTASYRATTSAPALGSAHTGFAANNSGNSGSGASAASSAASVGRSSAGSSASSSSGGGGRSGGGGAHR